MADGLTCQPGHDGQAGLGSQLLSELACGRSDGDWLLLERRLKPGTRSAGKLATALVVVAASLVPGTLLALRDASQAIEDARFYPSPEGRRFLVAQRQILRLAENPRVHLLTDSGFLQLYQKDRRPLSTRSSSAIWSTRGGSARW